MNTGDAFKDNRSKTRLVGVNPKLDALIEGFARNSGGIQFIVTEGVRTLERQKQLVAAGASRTMKSKHLTGRAVDLAVVLHGEVRWDWPLYATLADSFVSYAKDTHKPSVHLVAGAHWRTFRDGPHFQLGDDE